MPQYDSGFFEVNRDRAHGSASVIVPIVLEFLQPRTVIDVGCGLGSWLVVFRDHGVEDLFGVDGTWVRQEDLEIPREKFLAWDLTKPLFLKRQFDLVVSLEVGEHLPPESAEVFVDTLTQLGKVVLFSAAIPFQGGTHHVNEQWPDYWAKLFRARSFEPVDCVRRRIWQDGSVETWYAQNILLYSHRDILQTNAILRSEWERTSLAQLSIVHPRHYLGIADPDRATISKLLQRFPAALGAIVRGR